MRSIVTYTLNSDELRDLLTQFAVWLANDDTSDAIAEGSAVLAARFLETWRVPERTSNEPTIVGNCSYCGREMYSGEPLFKESYGGAWIWVCYICHPLQVDAVPARADDDVKSGVPYWNAIHAPEPTGGQ